MGKTLKAQKRTNQTLLTLVNTLPTVTGLTEVNLPRANEKAIHYIVD